MLTLFEVSGYKNFDKTITLDFSNTRDYQFNTECVTNGLIGKMIIYGKNAIGKSNFCTALFDAFYHISQKYNAIDQEASRIDEYYLNVQNTNDYAEFRYVFEFTGDQVEYLYRKNAMQNLIYEKITINGKVLFEYDRKHPEQINAEELKKLTPTLLLDFENVSSVLNYVVSNTPLDNDHPLSKTVVIASKSVDINIIAQRTL